MNEEVISKKELLELTGISYGQLYRWKRKNIIPESWFIKKSSFTGQETYFPKHKILERIQKIIDMKDSYSLDELSNFFSPNPAKISLTSKDLIKNNILKKETLDLGDKILSQDQYDFQTILSLSIIEKLAEAEVLNHKQILEALTFLLNNELHGDLIGLSKENTLVWFSTRNKSDLVIEETAKIRIEFNVLDQVNALKVKLSEGQF